MPSDTRYWRTDSARRSPSARLYSAVPRSSQCPSIETIQVENCFSVSAFLVSAAWASLLISALSNAKNTGWRMPFLLISSSEPMSALEMPGSGGTLTGGASAIGSGGVGGRVSVAVSGGGAVGRATGGFLPPQAEAATVSASKRADRRWRRSEEHTSELQSRL